MPDENEQKIKIPIYTEVDLLKIKMKLGSGENPTMKHLLSCFEIKRWEKKENGELTSKVNNDLKEAKNAWMRWDVCRQIRENGRFKITTPFENTCPQCHGTGETYKFLRRLQDVKCMKCKDNPKAKCMTCHGSRIVKIQAITDVILDTTMCNRCKGLGFKPPKIIDNPAINGDTAKELKKKIPDTNLGAQVHAVDVGKNASAIVPMIIDNKQDEEIQKIKQHGSD